MKRKALKTVENKVIEFTPKEYEKFDEKAKDIYERPLIFGGKRLTREQRYEFQDIIKVTYPKGTDISKLSPTKMASMAKSEGHGRAYKYLWDNCIRYIKNVIIVVGKETKTYDKVEDEDTKNLLWDGAEGFDSEIIQAVSHYIGISNFSKEESKN